MATFVKDVLYPGTYWVSDGGGKKRQVVYSRQDVEALRQRMSEMLAAGLSIPLAAEHQDQAKPLTDAERKAAWVKQLTMGWANSAELAPEGYLTAKVEVPDEADARCIPANRFVSPEIVNDFVDGTGRMWPGPSITHLAVTPRPVNAQQKPFQPVRMSHVVRLSLDDFEGEHMAEEREEKEEGKEDKSKEGKPKEGREEKPKAEEGGLDLAGLRGLLDGDGYAVPGHITEPNEFLKHLHTAALSKKAMIDKLLEDVDEDEEEEEQTPAAGESGGVLPEGVAPDNGAVLMSLCGRTFRLAGEPKKKAKVQMSQGNDRFEKALIEREKKDLRGRIKALFESGRINKPMHDKLLQDLASVRMSLDDNGALAGNSVLAKVEFAEDLSAGSAWASTSELPPDVRPAPENAAWQGHESPEQVKQTVDDFFGLLPGATAAK